jgi:hypothetical protein
MVYLSFERDRDAAQADRGGGDGELEMHALTRHGDYYDGGV